MNLIKRLSPRVAEQIAAGEVIERPASVIKELLENSLDAGATDISVRLENGGRSLIEVLDNGSGISPEDLPLALERHATSKIRELDDLEKLQTLGFRGEALASIGAVSRLEVLSRGKGQTSAYCIQIDHSTQQLEKSNTQAITFGHFLGSETGTRIRSEGIFSLIPARLKFLKSESAEISVVREWIEKLALSHPNVGFRLQSNDRTLLHLRPQTELERVRTLLAEGEDYPVRTLCLKKDQGLQLKVYWIQGLSLSSSKKMFQIVNGRVLRDKTLQQAIMNPFRQTLLPGKFPAILTLLEINPGELDVNVHPTKSEIRFLDSRKIFSIFDETIGTLLRAHGTIGFAGGASPVAHEDVPFFSTSTESTSSPWLQLQASEWVPKAQSLTLDTELPNALSAFTPENFLGVLFRTFLAFDLGEELGLIDQHAAHERIRYEKLKARALKRAQNQDVQNLLIPEVIHFEDEQTRLLESRLLILQSIGFHAEIFGPGKLLFRTIPPEWGNFELKTRLRNLIDSLLSFNEEANLPDRVFMDDRLFERLASEACHSSIRAGDRLSILTTTELLHQLRLCEHPWNCPHGRPTVVRVPRARFEEWFQRIV